MQQIAFSRLTNTYFNTTTMQLVLDILLVLFWIALCASALLGVWHEQQKESKRVTNPQTLPQPEEASSMAHSLW